MEQPSWSEPSWSEPAWSADVHAQNIPSLWREHHKPLPSDQLHVEIVVTVVVRVRRDALLPHPHVDGGPLWV